MKKFRCDVGSWGGLIYNDSFFVFASSKKEAEERALKVIKKKLGEDFGLFEYDLYQGNGGYFLKEVSEDG